MHNVPSRPKPQNVEDTVLGLPSDFTPKERLDFQLEGVAREEKFLREGSADIEKA